MMATEREISNIFEWLKTTKHVCVNVEWLGACISWLKSRRTTQANLTMVSKTCFHEPGATSCPGLPIVPGENLRSQEPGTMSSRDIMAGIEKFWRGRIKEQISFYFVLF